MSDINSKTVERVAALSRLELDHESINKLTGQMQQIVDFVEKINELDTDGIEPTAHAITVNNVTREDKEVASPATLDEILKLAPERNGNFIAVPRVIE